MSNNLNNTYLTILYQYLLLIAFNNTYMYYFDTKRNTTLEQTLFFYKSKGNYRKNTSLTPKKFWGE